jgi:hypothetical protein
MQISRVFFLYGQEISILLFLKGAIYKFYKKSLSMFSYVLIAKALLSQNS